MANRWFTFYSPVRICWNISCNLLIFILPAKYSKHLCVILLLILKFLLKQRFCHCNLNSCCRIQALHTTLRVTTVLQWRVKTSELLRFLLNCLLWRLDSLRAVSFQYHGHCLDQQSEKELFPEAPSLLAGQRESEIRSAYRNTIG